MEIDIAPSQSLQTRAAEWVESHNLQLHESRERSLRFIEEAIETVQPFLSRDDIARVASVVYSKPVGDVRKEAGGAGITLLALAECNSFSLDEAIEDELDRVSALPAQRFHNRNMQNARDGIGSAAGAFSIAFDYRHQAWLENGRYIACGHCAPCDCYGRLHEGEPAAPDADIH